ncbi:MAG: hypothetical protein D5R99_01130 [Methanocalculus sp. MSAO_Arc1]|uniref:DUF5803 family protein n=1 Tax=Methanocalculus TaxID=71151 RepID=UPI000FF52A8D|nr:MULTISPECIES: DUF5803 family protein [unclassified Methanocalculus]MCP1663090.1 hypothetical protein [Methanocalculus sp. AMF5]RQD81762.1 MAG: hypothetical protein D5R99_01130 [Methanocalculus sp. MSAO_Arc1]
MQSPNRDRCIIACLTLCLAALILVAPGSALHADFEIYENGSGYSAEIGIIESESYQFARPGLLGEAVPMTVRDIRLVNESGSVDFEQPRDSEITFPKGDYLLYYEGDLEGNSFSAVFSEPHNVTVFLPPAYGVTNLLLGYVSRGGSAEVDGDTGTVITWEEARFVEIRFYDDIRELALYAFGTIWIALMIILLFTYYAMRLPKEEERPE